MEENKEVLNSSLEQLAEPNTSENSVKEQVEGFQSHSSEKEGQSSIDPSEDLILGKFKSVEDLSKAYQELQRFQGQSSEELGRLRRESDSVNDFAQSLVNVIGLSEQMVNSINEVKSKYNTPEYFQDSNFNELYKEAFSALGANLDSDKFIELLEKYVNSRFVLQERSKSAQEETQNILDSMTYSKNPNSTIIPPKKSLDEMTAQEVDELLERLI